ncbi:MAG: hypothetical protein Q9213_002332 [Squamulea squamosa]
MPSYNAILAAAFAFAPAINAHMKMAVPAPYTANGELQNGPLDASGSDYPCKMTSGQYTPPATKNIIPIGAPQTLGLLGEATHGGGSCQIALTKDLKPTKKSVWMVIHSEEGGCPSAAPGNKGSNANAPLDAFKYTIPQGINPGEYTFAWTWFNKIGNREMYMNCAPVTITGGSKKREVDEGSFNTTQETDTDEIFKRDANFPDLFKANIGNGCSTSETVDVQFPNPGSSLNKASTAALGPPKGSCGSGTSSGSSGSGSPAASPAAGASGSTPSAAAGNPGTPTVSGEGSESGSGSASSATGVATPAVTSIVAIPPPGAPGPAKASAAQSVMSAMASVGSAAASVATAQAPSPAATGNASSSSSSSSSGSTGSGAAPSTGSCSTPGQSVCSPDGMMIGTCDMNKTVKFMAVATGTKCSNGQMVHAKRSAKFARRYGRHY